MTQDGVGQHCPAPFFSHIAMSNFRPHRLLFVNTAARAALARSFSRRLTEFYDYIGQLTMMYSAKHFGLIQIKDIKKNNDYAIRLQLYKKHGTQAHLLKEKLAKYRVRKKSISHDKLNKKLKSHYDLFHYCDGKSAIVAVWYACWNMWFGEYSARVEQIGRAHV